MQGPFTWFYPYYQLFLVLSISSVILSLNALLAFPTIFGTMPICVTHFNHHSHFIDKVLQFAQTNKFELLKTQFLRTFIVHGEIARFYVLLALIHDTFYVFVLLRSQMYFQILLLHDFQARCSPARAIGAMLIVSLDFWLLFILDILLPKPSTQ